jgi:hypothetical protein
MKSSQLSAVLAMSAIGFGGMSLRRIDGDEWENDCVDPETERYVAVDVGLTPATVVTSEDHQRMRVAQEKRNRKNAKRLKDLSRTIRGE